MLNKEYFKNYKGECWHNALTTLLCFSDELKEDILQKIKTLSTKTIIENAKERNYTLPFNIELENVDIFYEYIKHYLGCMKTRLLNLGNPNFVKVKKKLSCEQKTSLKCIEYIYNITNINILDEMKRHYDIEHHTGSLDTYITIVSIFNHLLLDNKCIIIKDDIFNNHKNSLSSLNNCIGILIRLRNDNTHINHLVAFYINKNKYFYYDDNEGIKIFNWKKYLNLSIIEDYKDYKDNILNMIIKLNDYDITYKILSISYVIVKKYDTNNIKQYMTIQKDNIYNYLYCYNNSRVIDNIKLLNYNLINKKNIYFKMHLILSASCDGNINIIKQLLKKKSRINVKDTKGNTPLNCASKNGYFDIVKLLVKNQALINIKDMNGLTPLKNAINEKHNNIVNFLRNFNNS